MYIFSMSDGDLPLKTLAARVFFETQDIEDVLEMLQGMMDPIFEQVEGARDAKLSLGGLDRDGANGTILLTKEDGQFGITGFMIKRNGKLIDGHSMTSNMFDAYNLNSREGLMVFAVKLYEDAAQSLASNEAAKRFEQRRLN